MAYACASQDHVGFTKQLSLRLTILLSAVQDKREKIDGNRWTLTGMPVYLEDVQARSSLIKSSIHDKLTAWLAAAREIHQAQCTPVRVLQQQQASLQPGPQGCTRYAHAPDCAYQVHPWCEEIALLESRSANASMVCRAWMSDLKMLVTGPYQLPPGCDTSKDSRKYVQQLQVVQEHFCGEQWWPGACPYSNARVSQFDGGLA